MNIFILKSGVVSYVYIATKVPSLKPPLNMIQFGKHTVWEGGHVPKVPQWHDASALKYCNDIHKFASAV